MLLAATLFLVLGKGLITPRPGLAVPFELLATDVGGQMHIRWNGQADGVAQAEGAVFEVGAENWKDRFPVSRGMLASGAIDYTRKADDVAVTLVLYKDGRETERRIVRSVSAPGNR